MTVNTIATTVPIPAIGLTSCLRHPQRQVDEQHESA
jgi:hypothetical protein